MLNLLSTALQKLLNNVWALLNPHHQSKALSLFIKAGLALPLTRLIHNPSDPKPNLPLLWENTNMSGTPHRKEWSHKLLSWIWANPRKKKDVSRWMTFHHSSVIKRAKNYLRSCNGLIPSLVKGDLLPVFKQQKNNNYSPRSYTHFIKCQMYCKFLEKCSGEQHGQDLYNIMFFNTTVKNIAVLSLQLRSNTIAIWLSAV